DRASSALPTANATTASTTSNTATTSRGYIGDACRRSKVTKRATCTSAIRPTSLPSAPEEEKHEPDDRKDAECAKRRERTPHARLSRWRMPPGVTRHGELRRAADDGEARCERHNAHEERALGNGDVPPDRLESERANRAPDDEPRIAARDWRAWAKRLSR